MPRIEYDTCGPIEVDDHCYWGAQTERSRRYFHIGQEKMPYPVIEGLIHIKKTAAIANVLCHVLDPVRKEAIVYAAHYLLTHDMEQHFPLVVWQTGSGTQTNMNVNEVIAFIANQYLKEKGITTHPIHPNDHVNRSQSSNDCFPTAMHIAATRAIHGQLLPALTNMRDVLEGQSHAFQSIIKIARTHLQDATSITLGQEFKGYATQISLGIKRIDAVMPRVYALAQGATAVGTGINCPPDFTDHFMAILAKDFALPFITCDDFCEAIACHDGLVELSGALNVIAVSLFKIANDIRFLGSGPRCGLGELHLPENEPGSSIMPGKVNPTQAEALTMIAAQVMGNHTTVTIAGSQGHLELNVFKPVIIYNVLQSITLLADGIHSFTEHCLKGITPCLEKMHENREKSLMHITSLTPQIGYEKAAHIAKHAYEHNISLKEAAVALGIMTAEAFDAALFPVDDQG